MALPPNAQTDPFEFWTAEENRIRYATLHSLAAKFLPIPCSSAESERLFSEVSLILSDVRKKLSMETLEMLTFLHGNIPLIGPRM